MAPRPDPLSQSVGAVLVGRGRPRARRGCEAGAASDGELRRPEARPEASRLAGARAARTSAAAPRRRPAAAALALALALAFEASAAGGLARPEPTAQAQGSSGFLGELSLSGSGEPIVVRSKELELDYRKNRVFYRGEVHVVQGDLSIDCDELIVALDEAEDVRQASVAAIVAVGNVVIAQGERRATGGKAIFNQKTRQIALVDHPVLRDGPNEVRGDRLTVFLDEGRSVMESRGQRRVSAVLYPDWEEEPTPTPRGERAP